MAVLPDSRLALGCDDHPTFFVWDFKRGKVPQQMRIVSARAKKLGNSLSGDVCTDVHQPASNGFVMMDSATHAVNHLACLQDGELLAEVGEETRLRQIADAPMLSDPPHCVTFIRLDGTGYAPISQSKTCVRPEEFAVAADGQSFATISAKGEVRVFRKGLPEATIFSDPENMNNLREARLATSSGLTAARRSFPPPFMAIVGDRIMVQYGSKTAVFD